MRAIFAAAAAIVIAVPAAAHHGWSSYDETKPVTVMGSFATVSWGNPHGSATIRWQGATWDVILAPTSRMTARGLSEEMITPPRKVSITGYVRKDGTKEMRVERVMVDGKTVELR